VTSPLGPAPGPETREFWTAAREGRVTAQRCAGCGAFRFPPGPVCRRCGSDGVAWVGLSGAGKVVSWTVTHQPYHPDLVDAVPYTVLLVELAEQPGLLMYGNTDIPAAELRDRLPVRAVFRAHPDGWTRVDWAHAW